MKQGTRIKKTKLYFIIGIVIVSLLIAAVLIRQQIANQVSHISIHPTSEVFHINIPPTVLYPTIPPSAPAYIVDIHSVGASGVIGTATFEDIAGALAILLHIDGLGEDNLATTELHFGACESPGSLAYVLVTPDALESETDLSINLKQFNEQKTMAVILYRSSQDRTVIACGDNLPSNILPVVK